MAIVSPQKQRNVSSQSHFSNGSSSPKNKSSYHANISNRNSPIVYERYRKAIDFSKGHCSKDTVEWCYNYNPQGPTNSNVSNGDWQLAALDITPKGELYLNHSVVLLDSLQHCRLQLFQNLLLIKIISNSQTTVYTRFGSFKDYEEFLSCLLVWQNLKPAGIKNKWTFNKSIIYDDNIKKNDLLVCRFKVFGPLPNNKKVKTFSQPANPLYPSDPSETGAPEGWFIAMGYLKADGILDLLCESDGSKLYSLDITKLFSSEIREVHHSILQTSNVLYLGAINELRNLHVFKNETDSRQNETFFKPIEHTKKPIKCKRILIDFDLRIDLEDWFVTLSSFTRLEFVGNTITQQRMRVVKKAKLEILEANLNDYVADTSLNLYCEVVMWNAPWFRTAIAKNNSQTPFWKEMMEVNLPSSCDYFKISIKASSSEDLYNVGRTPDITLGTAFITPSLLTKPQFMSKIPIYTNSNDELGQLIINLNLEERHLLPFHSFRMFEKFISLFDIEILIKFLQPSITPKNLEEISSMLLNVYQTLYKETEFFENLMKIELKPIDSAVRNNRMSRVLQSVGTSTIFRKNTILSKTLEKYAIRVGQEYLEKLLSGFISQITREDFDCECDPKYAPETHLANYGHLLRYIEMLWDKIYKTSNDLPQELKEQWKNLRNKVDMAVEPNDRDTPLNAVNSFIFLRFLCPALLNPKLFNLTKTHVTGRTARTLTLLAKILMVFSSRSRFQPHKEAYLLKLNDDFIQKHREEMIIYCDKITGRRMDFNEKVLEMSNVVERLSLNASNQVLNELPTMPYLIDKYLNFYKLAEILDSKNESEEKENIQVSNRNAGLSDLEISHLEFEETDFGSEEFLRNLMKVSNSQKIQDFMFESTLDKTTPKLLHHASLLVKRKKNLDRQIHRAEVSTMFAHESWTVFVDSILKTLRLTEDNYIVYDQAPFSDPTLMARPLYNTDFEVFITSLSKKGGAKGAFGRTNNAAAVPQGDMNSTLSGSGSNKSVFKKLFTRRKTSV